MTFGLFFLGEYANMILMSSLTTILFLGGWLPPLAVCAVHLDPGGVLVYRVQGGRVVLFVFLWVPRARSRGSATTS